MTFSFTNLNENIQMLSSVNLRNYFFSKIIGLPVRSRRELYYFTPTTVTRETFVRDTKKH